MAKPVVKIKYTPKESVYLWEILKGMGITWRHMVSNIGASFKKGPHTVPTCWQYPEDRREISPVFRGEHMLTLDEKGREKCIGCGMCAKICPSQCITVKRGKVEEGQEDRYSGKTYCAEFEIDLLRCIFCGFCQEVCPRGEAIKLGQGYELARYDREQCRLTKDKLLGNFQKAVEEGLIAPPGKVETGTEPSPPAEEKKTGPAEKRKAEGGEKKITMEDAAKAARKQWAEMESAPGTEQGSRSGAENSKAKGQAKRPPEQNRRAKASVPQKPKKGKKSKKAKGKKAKKARR